MGVWDSIQRNRVVCWFLDQVGVHLLDCHTHARELEKRQAEWRIVGVQKRTLATRGLCICQEVLPKTQGEILKASPELQGLTQVEVP